MGSGTREAGRPSARGGWGHELRAIYTLWWRDLVRFVNEPARLMGFMVQPVIYLGLFGVGFGATFRAAAVPEGFRYVTFMFPGVLGMTVLFTALFSGVSVIWERRFGLLKAILVAPVSRAAIVLGKALGGSTVAVLQGTLLLLLAPLADVDLDAGRVLRLWAAMWPMALALTGLGLAIASRMSSMEGFQVVMNFLVMPMWLLSGAFFPLQGVPRWMEVLMRVNPLTYGVDALRGVVYEGVPYAGRLVAHDFAFNLAVVTLMAVVALGLSLATFKAREE
ncbi:MAG TPA: ABC transporter permease [Thermaerobacter sp.]|nr:MAG: ABC transporter [Bacillota bacterium]